MVIHKELSSSCISFLQPSGRWSLAFRYYTVCIPGLRAAAYAEQIGNSLFFAIPFVRPYNDGLYRCFSTNESVTAPDNSSQELRVKVHCKSLSCPYSSFVSPFMCDNISLIIIFW